MYGWGRSGQASDNLFLDCLPILINVSLHSLDKAILLTPVQDTMDHRPDVNNHIQLFPY